MRKKPRPICYKTGCENYVQFPTSIYCSVKCQQDQEYIDYIGRWKLGLESGTTCKEIRVSNHVVRYLREIHDGKCMSCGWDKKHPLTGKVPLTVHHIDGDASNNRENNLQILFPNCHSLTDNYGSLNRNSTRKKRHV